MESDSISVTVKFSGRTIPVDKIPVDSTIKDLKALLQPITNVLPRGQKLISKGKLLVDAMTLRESELTNGAKIMLMATQGLHQGDGPILKQAQTRPIIRENNAKRSEEERVQTTIDKNQLQRWEATGVVGLSERNLKAIPEEVLIFNHPVRVLDLSNNAIQAVPGVIACMVSLEKLSLDSNDLSDDSISWGGLRCLKCLTLLSLNNNHLTMLSPDLGMLTSLKQLNVANNKLSSLPIEMRHLPKLEILKANNNRISTIHTWIGDCIALQEIDLSSNILSDLPETISNLHNLKSLSLSNNGLKSLPSALFKMCLMLTRLDLHNTEITMDTLRQIEGWENFDTRRRLKQQKKLDFRVMGSAAFDEGADKS